MGQSQPNLFPDESPKGTPAIVIRLWRAVDEHYVHNVEPPTYADLSRILIRLDPGKTGSLSSVFRAIHKQHARYFPEWPIQRGTRPPWVTDGHVVYSRELPGLPAILWHDRNWLITDVSLGFLALFGWTSRDQVLGREVAWLIRHDSGPRYPILKRWTDLAYLANDQPRRMTRVAETNPDGSGSQTFTLEEPKGGAIFTVAADGRIADINPECLALLRYEYEQLAGQIPAPLLLRRPPDHSKADRLYGTSDMITSEDEMWRGDGSSVRLSRETWHASVHSNQPDGFFVHLCEPETLSLGRYLVPTLAAAFMAGPVLDTMDGKMDGVIHWCHMLAGMAHHLA